MSVTGMLRQQLTDPAGLSSYRPTNQTCKQKAFGGRQCSILSAIQV